ncbi:hypothetical protein [Halosimplex pelagicum]|jgi:hypothetical protein|uniref:Uncharacterized protein n=1 Tax=Halosimplex pelagicum TaxID=869886 RepID=A0A7D5TCQ8_9EURY|nr:hypothetical protein [Halosimplex pelagicum]QLH82275.1 hypothetical protein HZS54_11920 [Halosimplex pelagicum]
MSSSSSTLTLETIQNWLDENYNSAMSTYVYDDHVRLTNGSPAHYVDIYIADGQSLTLEGERYGETITKSCNAAKDALLDTLSKTI